MKNNKTLIGLILDRSGSMSGIAAEIVSGTNEYMKEQAGLPGEVIVYAAQFDDRYEVLNEFSDIKDFKPLTRETYTPRGMTAYYQAMSNTIDTIGTYLASMPEAERPEKVLIITVTDGLENASPPEFTGPGLKAKIAHQREKYNWDFIFLGSSLDTIVASKSLGMAKGSSLQYEATAKGTRSAFQTLNASTTSYRGRPRSMTSDENFWDKTPEPVNTDTGK